VTAMKLQKSPSASAAPTKERRSFIG
jgi:hypothetical protein